MMPELPEVEIIVRGLRPKVIGRQIANAQRSVLKMRCDSTAEVLERLCSQRVTEVKRRAKYIMLHCSQGDVLLLHLGMSGRLLFHEQDGEMVAHQHLQLSFVEGGALTLRDPRRFGMYEVVRIDALMQHKMLEKLGLEPLSEDFDAQYLYEYTRRAGRVIKSIIMDGNIIVGVGNIYASESMFMARINPMMPGSMLTLGMCADLVQAIKAVLLRAIESGGSSLRDYVHVDGSIGAFQNEFLVYGRDGQDCRICANHILRLKQGGRSTFYCADCQPGMM